MIFVLVILTFVVGIGISTFQESKHKRAQQTRATLDLTSNPVFVRVPSGPAKPYEPKTGELWVG